jgi:hypothetical protein
MSTNRAATNGSHFQAINSYAVTTCSSATDIWTDGIKPPHIPQTFYNQTSYDTRNSREVPIAISLDLPHYAHQEVLVITTQEPSDSTYTEMDESKYPEAEAYNKNYFVMFIACFS